ncbi:MAG: creatininase family protein [Anaerolineae bacterium]|nr:creatininase family protein [Anaerolineae bacterium]
MLLEECNWMHVEEYLEREDRIVLVTGATEQHGYLSLYTDTLIPYALAREIGERADVLVAPPVPFGVSPYFLRYPGTISLRTTTLLALIEDVIRSLHEQGFRRFFIVNGHGGNAPILGRLRELANELVGLRAHMVDWWKLPAVQAACAGLPTPPTHANYLENFPFTRLPDAEMPSESKPPVTLSVVEGADRMRELLGDGSFGGAYQVDDASMDRLFETTVETLLIEMGKLGPPGRVGE